MNKIKRILGCALIVAGSFISNGLIGGRKMYAVLLKKSTNSGFTFNKCYEDYNSFATISKYPNAEAISLELPNIVLKKGTIIFQEKISVKINELFNKSPEINTKKEVNSDPLFGSSYDQKIKEQNLIVIKAKISRCKGEEAGHSNYKHLYYKVFGNDTLISSGYLKVATKRIK